MSRLLPVDQIDPSPFSHLSPPDEENQQQIAEDLERTGEVLVPLHVVEKDGGRWELLAGHDRLEAAKLAGLTEVPVRDFSGTVVTDEEKASHVLRENNLRKGAPKRPGVEWWLERHPEWSDRRIAEEVGCSHTLVQNVRRDMEEAGDVATVATREDSIGRQQPASKPAAKPAPAPAPKPISKADQLRQMREEQAAGHDPRPPKVTAAPAGQTAPAREPSRAEKDLIRNREKRAQRGNTYAAIARLVYFADTVRGEKNIQHVVSTLLAHPDEFHQDQRRSVEDVIQAGETVAEWLPRFLEVLRSQMEADDAAA